MRRSRRKYLLCATVFVVASAAHPSFAGQAEAREMARMNNCPPKKVEVYRQNVGEWGETIYRVECVMPKQVDATASGPQASALLVVCANALCRPLRALESEKK